MVDGIGGIGGMGFGSNYAQLLANYIGQTVTIFTASGGQSGSGFTGVVVSVNEAFVRIVTRIGPPPGCSLGNACTGFTVGAPYGGGGSCGCGGGGPVAGAGSGPAGVVGAVNSGGWDGIPVLTVGSVADIPICQIVSFVHNAV